MIDVILEVATEAHVPLVAARMRKADQAEVMASGGRTPEAALEGSRKASELARTAFVNGEPLAMFGVYVNDALPYAVPWALTTDLVDRYPLLFWKASKKAFRKLAELYPQMGQAVDARHTQAISWLRRLGFEVHPAEPFGIAGLPFHPVTYREGRKHV